MSDSSSAVYAAGRLILRHLLWQWVAWETAEAAAYLLIRRRSSSVRCCGSPVKAIGRPILRRLCCVVRSSATGTILPAVARGCGCGSHVWLPENDVVVGEAESGLSNRNMTSIEGWTWCNKSRRLWAIVGAATCLLHATAACDIRLRLHLLQPLPVYAGTCCGSLVR